MIKEMKGWKVLTFNRNSCKAYNWVINGLDRSLAKKWSVNYPVGVEVKPKVEGTKLFFFKNREDAVLFTEVYDQIVPCIAKNVTKPKYVGTSVRNIGRFWESKNKHRSVRSLAGYPPYGTYLAESITCLE